MSPLGWVLQELNNMHEGNKGLQQLPDNSSITMSTLANLTALLVSSAYNGTITKTFLMKRYHYMMRLIGLTASDDVMLLVGIARGTLTVAEIATAIVQQTVNPEDPITSDDQSIRSRILWQSLRLLRTVGDGTVMDLDEFIHIGARGGIPFNETEGWNTFVFNIGGTMATGATLFDFSIAEGVWLNG